ncbi:Oxidoreductase, short chain dehydrogenase/reductase family protein [Minicystis rosea]|nr:Oxidoreductase, short chain dehydrogenase/reductase family protein [Minicystis rosea]
MANDLRFDGRVAIVTGAGNGLGRSHALMLGKRGAKVVVNDLGGSMHGGGQSTTPAQKVVDEIKAAGGDAIANADSVEDGGKIVQAALDTWGRIDIIVNNAGILRDTSFQKLSEEDWDLIYRVHVLGGFRVTRAAWNHMRDAGYGRIIFTASAAGIYGNFGQANYAMAKLGLVGLSNTLAIEGRKKNVFVNTIAPIAGSRLTETVLPKELVDALKPEFVSPLVAWLAHESCTETGGLFEVGGGFFSKLRWERTAGKSFSISKAIEPEAIAKSWSEITSFEKSEHPGDITTSMQSVIENLNKKTKGGNEFIDVDAALGFEFPPLTTSYTERDLALYALGVGAGTDPLDGKDLQYVYELHGDGFRAIPTYAVVPVINAILEQAKQGKQAPGLNYGFERILHGEQYTEVKRPLPPHQKLTHKSRIKDIWDKGKNAVVIVETRTYDEADQELAYNEISMVVRGAGGWGGERGPSGEVNTPPDRAPDAVIEQKINDDQALLYRLSGDWNPLHADPNFAQSFGFSRPILHGLCTFGFAARHVIKSFAGNDARLFKGIRARFAESVYPGETLVTEMWKDSAQRIVFRCKVKERDKVVIGAAAVELYAEVPKAVAAAPKAAAAPAAAPAPAAAAAPDKLTSADIFVAIGDYVAKTADLVSKVGTVFQFHLTGPDSAWVLDAKNGSGSVTAGTATADVTLTLSDADFLDMTSGKADPQKLFMSGKLKITGNIMASQKLMFLKKVDPQAAMAAIQKARGGAAPAAAPAAAAPAAAPDKLTSADIFVAIGDYVAKTADLVGKVGTVFQFHLKDPDSAWVIDVKNGKGSVTAGTATADVNLTLSDADFLDMTSGKADPQKLFMSGKLKITGNIMASQKLMFLKSVDPKTAMEAIQKARGGAAPAAAPAAAASSAKASKVPGIFKALSDRIEKTPSLVGEVAAVIQFVIKDSAGAWTVDLASGAGSVKEGRSDTAKTTITLTEEDLVALAKGESAQGLFQHGRLRVDGDIRPAHKLGFMKDLA